MHACGIDVAGVAFCWGNNDFGQLGDRSFTSSTLPVRVSDPPFGGAVSLQR